MPARFGQPSTGVDLVVDLLRGLIQEEVTIALLTQRGHTSSAANADRLTDELREALAKVLR